MPGDSKRWVALASQFPATLNSETESCKLRDGETPEAWGMDVDHPGYLAVGSKPTGTDRIIKTYTVGAATYTWYYDRLWLISGTSLLYGYPEYTAAYLPHDVPLDFKEDAQAIVTFFPFLQKEMFVAKSTGGYIMPNAISREGGFRHGDINPALGVATAAQAQELDGVAYISTSAGFFMWDSQGVVEISQAFRSLFSRFAADTLKRDEAKRRIVGNTFVYDPATKSFFDFSQSGFRFTTRTLQSKNSKEAAEKPFSVDKIGLFFNNTTQGDHSITYQIRRDEDWEDPETLQISWSDAGRTWMEWPTTNAYDARNYQLRITSMTPGLQIKSINVLADVLSQTEQSWSQ